MGNTDRERFEANWQKFTTQLRGQMMIEAKKQKLTYPMLKLMLASHVGYWDSRQKEGGRWLDAYEAANPEKGALVREILVKDMCFSEEEDSRSQTDIWKYAVPVGGAAAGFAISHALGAAAGVQAVATVAPAVIGYPLAGSLSGSARERGKKELLDRYMAQLQKYKKSVESILSSGN